jgi:hypothetical protein
VKQRRVAMATHVKMVENVEWTTGVVIAAARLDTMVINVKIRISA